MATDQEIQELTAAARQLIDRLDVLATGTGDQLVGLAIRARRNRQMIGMLAVSLTLDVILTAFMVFGILQLNHVTARVDSTIKLTQSEVLCPLYQQFINSDTPAQRALAEKNGQDMKQRAEAFRVIRHSYVVLNCKG